MDKVLTVADLRPIMQVMFPAVEDERDDNEKYEHPMTAVGLVLLSAAIISTTEATKLVLFTGYSRPFISAITFNMQNNQLWVGGRYDASTWLSLDGTINADGMAVGTAGSSCGPEWSNPSSSRILSD